MKNGHIIFLNGTSSSGKTTIAKALQEKSVAPYMHLSVDDFFHMYPERYISPTSQEDAEIFISFIPAVISGFHQCISALARSGNHLIVDHVLQEAEWLKACVEACRGIEVLFVGVKCPLDITEQREKERGYRNIGTARYQFERVHAHGLYDVEVDTSVLTVDDCTAKILASRNPEAHKSAFQVLETRFAFIG